MTNLFAVLILIGIVAAVMVAVRYTRRSSIAESPLGAGRMLPLITAEDDSGRTVTSAELLGKPAVIIFVRGTWCPFCNEQVRDLTSHYRRINELGARLIFITAKPLATTRRVAELFEVDFTFWLDPELSVAQQLGIIMPNGIPPELIKKFGKDTVWPTSLVVDSRGLIRYVKRASDYRVRPDPAALVRELEKI